MKIVVCGGHKVVKGSEAYWDLEAALYHRFTDTYVELAHGGATGVDTFAGEIAKEHQVFCIAYPPNSLERTLGKWGKFIRNGRMLADFKPDLVIAVKLGAGNGTRNCASQAAAMGIDVEWV